MMRYYRQRGKMPRLPGEGRTCNEGTPIGVPYKQWGMYQNGKPNAPTKNGIILTQLETCAIISAY